MIGAGAIAFLLGQPEVTLAQQILTSHSSFQLAQSSTPSDQKAEADRLFQQGNQQFSVSQFREALQSWEQALNIYREIGDRQGEANALGGLGIAYASLGDYPKAIEFLQQSLAIARDIGDRQWEAGSLGNLGIAYASLGDYPKAIELHQQSLAIARDLGDHRGEASSLGNLGNAYFSLGDYPKAIELHQQYLAIARDIGDRQGEAYSLNNLGFALLELGQFAKAETQLFSAIQVLESLRASELSDADKVSLFETQTRTYQLLQQSLIAQKQPDKTRQALVVSERGRARAFVELLANPQATPQATPISTQSPDILAIQRIAQQQNATLVQYSVINLKQLKPTLYIWVIQPTGDIQFRSVDLAAAALSLADLTTNNLQSLGVRGGSDRATVIASATGTTSPEQQKQNLQKLHKLLVQPIADLLPTNPESHVIFIPQGNLFLVPFPALQDENGKYLIEQHTILTAPSIQVLDLVHEQRQQLGTQNLTSLQAQDLLVVGNPSPMPKLQTVEGLPQITLPSLLGAKKEAEAIATFFRIPAMLEGSATETTVKQRMTQARIIHLATHGLLEYGIPQDSGVRDLPGAIALAPSATDDGLLTSSEILGMKLKAELVVLSACDTGRGQITGDGVIGLSRSLITAGVPSVMVSLWAVNDDSTSILMTEFYRQLQQNPDKAQALRQAMLKTMQRYDSPRDWAAFTLIGEAE